MKPTNLSGLYPKFTPTKTEERMVRWLYQIIALTLTIMVVLVAIGGITVVTWLGNL